VAETAQNEAKAVEKGRHPLLESATDRIHYVADLMASAVWNERTSRRLQKDLGEAWGVSPSTIRNYSTEAGRAIRTAIVERRASIAQRAIDRLERIAAQDPMHAGVQGLPGAIVHANEVLLKLSGYSEPDEDKIQRHIVAGANEATPDKAREIMKGLFGDVTPQESPSDLDEPSST
jgi:hypothetical protein